MVDEVREQLAVLNSTVQGTIFAGLNSINGLLISTQTAVQQEYDIFSSEITTLKDLAQIAGHNVDMCLETNQSLLDQLPQTIMTSLADCMSLTNTEVAIIMNDAKYIQNIRNIHV